MRGQVVILGPGLLGGSLALALAARDQTPVVWGRRQPPLDFLARASSKIRVEAELEAALEGADFVVLATPIGVMPSLLEQIAEWHSLDPEAVITDVGSVKGPIVESATRILAGSGYKFVGSHPMAGSEASGVEAARVDLFNEAMCLLTPNAVTDPVALAKTRRFWSSLNGRVHDLDPHEHDRIVAHVSHMPHALASVMVSAALGENPQWAHFAGGGLPDTTRIASGEPGMWAEILLENRQAVLDVLRATQSKLHDLVRQLESGENQAVYRFLLEAKELRDTHIVPRQNGR